MTKVEGDKAVFPCEWSTLPSNATVVWLRDDIPVRQISSFESRVETPGDGSLIVYPVHANDSGFFECHVSNGIGDLQIAVAYLNVEYPAQVTYAPTVQYLPHHLAGVVRCYIMANPPLQLVMWTRGKHLFNPYKNYDDFIVMNNGSLLIDRVKDIHQGNYTCTPYNFHGTKGSSLQMQVIVKEPPKFEVTPDPMYLSKLGSSLEIPCSAVATNGTTSPLITWQRRDGKIIPRDRMNVVEGSLTIENLQQMDYGEYECIASNEVASLVTGTKIIVEDTKPHAPFNITATSAVFSVTLTWSPGYSGGQDFRQSYVVWYRLLGESIWDTIHVTLQGSTRITIRNLNPGTTYQFKVFGFNDLGEGHPSEIINATTKGVAEIVTNGSLGTGSTPEPVTTRPPQSGPKPGAPWNVTLSDNPGSFAITVSWRPPVDSVAVAYYQIQYRPEGEQWKQLNKEPIHSPRTSYSTRSLRDGYVYHIRVIAFTTDSYLEMSEPVVYKVPVRDKQRAIISGIVSGLLIFIVVIILSVCAIEICTRRKLRKQEKGPIDTDSNELLCSFGWFGCFILLPLLILLLSSFYGIIRNVFICLILDLDALALAYNMVACRLTDAKNGGQIPTQPQVPPIK